MCTAAHVNESRWRLLAVFRNNQCLLRALFEQFLEFRQSCNILTKCLTLLGGKLCVLFGEHFTTNRATFGYKAEVKILTSTRLMHVNGNHVAPGLQGR